MTASEAALDRLPAPDRAKAIERILSTTPESQRPITLDRYRSLGLTPDP